MARAPLTTIVSTKGQVILPKAIRERRRWPAGTRLTVEDTDAGCEVFLSLDKVLARKAARHSAISVQAP